MSWLIPLLLTIVFFTVTICSIRRRGLAFIPWLRSESDLVQGADSLIQLFIRTWQVGAIIGGGASLVFTSLKIPEQTRLSMSQAIKDYWVIWFVLIFLVISIVIGVLTYKGSINEQISLWMRTMLRIIMVICTCAFALSTIYVGYAVYKSFLAEPRVVVVTATPENTPFPTPTPTPVPSPTPVPVATSVCDGVSAVSRNNRPDGNYRVHRVKLHETLSSIARLYGITELALREANFELHPYLKKSRHCIWPDQLLIIPEK